MERDSKNSVFEPYRFFHTGILFGVKDEGRNVMRMADEPNSRQQMMCKGVYL